MKQSDLLLAAAGALTALCCGAARADDGIQAHARLIGYQEVPALASGATGTFQATLSPSSFSFVLSYSGLDASPTQAHIHFGQKSVNGGISVFLCSNLGNGPAGTQPCPSPGGTVTGTITAASVIGPTGQDISPGQFEALIRAMRAGITYANVHSTKFPAGEIRGQIKIDD
ncbi:MAG TPA: CHRD domain-containing protein [Methylibium sp.]